MKKTLILLSVFILSACASFHQTLVDISGIERVEIEQDNYTRPQFYVEEFKFSKNSREIASASVPEEHLSNRQLYFLSFYKQYLTLGKLLNEKQMITSCPSFHNVMVNYQDELKAQVEDYTTEIDLSLVKKNERFVSYFPVLALPYTAKSDLYSYLVNEKWEDTDEHLLTALKNYYEIEKNELSTLCDTGVSPGYYVYENLVSYFKGDDSFHRTQDGLKALLKVPVIANMLILDNLKSQSYPKFKAQSRFEAWLMSRSNLAWFGEYRNSLLNNKTRQISANY